MTKEDLEELWIEFAEDYTNRKFDRNKLPAGIKLYLKLKFERSTSDATIQNKKLSDMSITYFSKQELSKEELDTLSPYKKLKVI